MDQRTIDETIVLLQELIRNECINPPGNEMKSITTIAKFLKSNGIEYEIFEVAPNRGNLIARIKGAKQGPSVMFGPAHVDVVPVDRLKEWIVPPFSAEIKDEAVWGRGAIDMLFIVAAQVQAFCQLVKEKDNLDGELILVVVADEEMGGKFGAEWLIKNHPNKMKCDYALSEMGGIPFPNGNIGFMIGEKGASWLRLSFSGTPQHGSIPFRSDNAILKAACAAIKLSHFETPVTTKYLKYLLKGMGYNAFTRFIVTRKIFLPLILNNMIKKKPQIAKLLHSLTHMTISPNILKGGLKANIIAADAYLDLDIRTLPEQNFDYILSQLQKALGKKLFTEAKIEVLKEEGIVSYGNTSLLKSKLTIAIEKATQKILPNSSFIPILNPGATDLRFLREQNAQCVGFALFDNSINFKELTNHIHGVNERVTIRTIEYTLKAYYYVAKELLNS